MRGRVRAAQADPPQALGRQGHWVHRALWPALALAALALSVLRCCPHGCCLFAHDPPGCHHPQAGWCCPHPQEHWSQPGRQARRGAGLPARTGHHPLAAALGQHGWRPPRQPAFRPPLPGANPILLTLGMHLRGSALPYCCGYAGIKAAGLTLGFAVSIRIMAMLALEMPVPSR